MTMMGDKMTDKIARGFAVALFVVVLVAGWAMACAPPAPAQPLDPYFPIPPIWCPGGGTQTGWGGFCEGRSFPDGTRWHSDNFVAPFVGSVWNPITCVVHTGQPMPPLAGPGGCGGAV